MFFKYIVLAIFVFFSGCADLEVSVLFKEWVTPLRDCECMSLARIEVSLG